MLNALLLMLNLSSKIWLNMPQKRSFLLMKFPLFMLKNGRLYQKRRGWFCKNIPMVLQNYAHAFWKPSPCFLKKVRMDWRIPYHQCKNTLSCFNAHPIIAYFIPYDTPKTLPLIYWKMTCIWLSIRWGDNLAKMLYLYKKMS